MRSDVFEGVSAEVFEVHELCQLRIDDRELVERIGEPIEGAFRGCGLRNLITQLRDMEACAALQRAALAYQIDDEATHHARGIADESLAIGKHRIPWRYLQIRLVEQRRRADHRTRIAPQQTIGELAQLTIESHEALIVRCSLEIRLPGGRALMVRAHASLAVGLTQDAETRGRKQLSG